MMKKKLGAVTGFICMFLLISISASASDYIYKAPPSTGDGWQTADISDVNMDKEKIAGLIREISDKPLYYNIHSILVIKNGKLVLEEYFPGENSEKRHTDYGREDFHDMMSVSKSFTSTLVGIAIDRGMIKGAGENLVALYPEYAKKLEVENKGRIKLNHVLSMSAGFDWDEVTYLYNDFRNPYFGIIVGARGDLIGYILDRPMKSQPGEKFAYNSGLTILLGNIVERTSSLTFPVFANQYLFEPLNITKFAWGHWNKKGKVPKSDAGLFLRPRDMAKLGQLFVNKGTWNGRRIVSAQWIEEATRTHSDPNRPEMVTGYGYQWWLYEFPVNEKPVKAYAAHGYGGQRIFVFPTLDLVVAFTAGNYFIPHAQVGKIMYQMVNDHILPAIGPVK